MEMNEIRVNQQKEVSNKGNGTDIRVRERSRAGKRPADMKTLTVAVVLLLLIHCGGSLKCYTCLFPTLSPMDCIKFPVNCAPKERCLSSTATGKTKHFPFVLHEMSCAVSSLCGISGQKNTLGINVTYQNTCCDTDLCNAATATAATASFALLPLLLHPLLL
ncbi:ly6/PLAUR domain-containing protein 2-like [Hyperolius riggenbachi]|uniref:ly6/PLAUR domain-containing protein 2-like n=1 Tax=Hyperolius riggenbachi TaxID=752182 RepID=UPI0035A2B936